MRRVLALCVLVSSIAGFATAPVPPRQSARLPARRGYEESSGAVKGIVGGLTALVNAIAGGAAEADEVDNRPPVSAADLATGLRGDFDRGYLFSGEIDSDLYDLQCRFTDPTLSFVGLRQFEKNIRNLGPILDAAFDEPRTTLFSLTERPEDRQVIARWRMAGEINAPWKPFLELEGETTFSYNEVTGRVVDYDEAWVQEAGAVLLQLVRPGGGRAAPTDEPSREAAESWGL